MHNYSLTIHYSIWILILLIIIAFALSYYYYKITVPPISNMKRKFLMIIRGIGLSLLIALLFEPIISLISTTEKESKLAVLIDNSKSMSLKDDLFDRKSELLKSIENSNFLNLGYDNLHIEIFDDKPTVINEFNVNDLKLNGQTTNISSALSSLNQNIYDDNIEAVLLITDGTYNSGLNPIYKAQELAIPIYTIGIGDSLPPKDISIESIIANEIAYLNKSVPINVNININGYQNKNIKLDLYDNNDLISSQEFHISDENNNISAMFDYQPKIEGVHKLLAKINQLDDEITFKNNTKSIYINVLKNKDKITIFAGAPSSDISFVYNLLSQDNTITIKNFVQKDINSFYLSNPTETDLKESEMFILIGYPNNYSSDELLKKLINELSKGKSLLFISSRDINYSKLRYLEPYLPFKTTSSRSNEFNVLVDINPNAVSNPILKIKGTDEDIKFWNSLPPIFKTETFVKSKPESEVLSYLKINNLPMKEPLILSRNFSGQKSVAILGYGLYRWKLLDYAAHYAKNNEQKEDLFAKLIQNSLQWLSVDLDKKLVTIQTSKKYYNSNEKVKFIGQIYDQSYNPIEDAVINVKIEGINKNYEITLNSIGNGNYESEIEGLSEGDYFFQAEAYFRGKIYGKDKGRFSIGEIDLEYHDLQMKADLLRNISNLTGGKFYTPQKAANFLKDLKSLRNFKQQPTTLKTEFLLWNNYILILIIVVLFSIEWFIRKRAGLL